MRGTRVRVLFDARAMSPHASGIGVYSQGLCAALLSHHAGDAELFVFDGTAAVPVHAPEDLVSATARVSDGDLYRYGAHLRAGSAARACRAHVYHFPDFFAPLTARVPMVVTIHDVVPLAHPEFLGRSKKARLRALFRLYAKLAVRRAALTLTDSEFSRGEIVRHLGVSGDRVRVVHLGRSGGRDIDDRDEAAGRPLPAVVGGRVTPGRYLLFVGRHDPYKGIPRLLDAWRDVMRDGRLPGWRLVITGRRDPRYDAELEIRARGLSDTALCTGYVSGGDLAALYAHAGALVLPSLYEGFGLPPLDALWYDIPVACSDRASLPEIVGDAALLFDPDDADGLRNALVAIATDASLRARLIEHGRARRTHFSWRATAEGTMRAYLEAARGKRMHA